MRSTRAKAMVITTENLTHLTELTYFHKSPYEDLT